MRNDIDKTKLIVRILIAVVALLVIIVLYLTVFQQQYNNFVNQKRIEGIDLFIGQVLIPQLQQTGGYIQIPLGNQTMNFILIQSMISQIKKNNYVQIPIGNQTLYLVPVQPQPAGSTARNANSTPAQ